MKQILIEIDDELYEQIERLARMDNRRLDDWIVHRLKCYVYGSTYFLPPMTDEEREELAAKVLGNRTKRVNFKASVRAQVYQRDKGKCRHCGGRVSRDNEVWHIDHLVPLSRGGTNDMDNLALSCARCNLEKSNKVAA